MSRELTADDIFKGDFQAYEDVRRSGICNMFSSMVQEYCGFSREVHIAIIKNYSALCQKWPDVRQIMEEV